MNCLLATFWAELLKIRTSKMFWGTIVVFVFISCMMGLLFLVQIHPEISSKLGIIGTKASMLKLGPPTWENYFSLLIQGIASIGLIGVGFVASWVFGSEFSEHTIKDILALPVSRTYIVVSKFLVVTIWSIILSVVFFAVGLFIGSLIGFSDWSKEVYLHFAKNYVVTYLLLLFLSTPVAFFASYGRGYMISLGFVILTLILASFIGMVGLGPYFPWAIPGLYGAPGGTADQSLTMASYIILGCTSALGLFGTLFFWKFADHK
jgi:ABC-type transport system involved in multi-copper enzyme maturation permease subunit